MWILIYEMEKLDIVEFIKKQKCIIFEELENISNLTDEDKKLKLDQIFLKADEMKKYIHQNLPVMISYEIGVCNNLIKEIDSRISAERDNKKAFKFSFNLKSKSNTRPKPAKNVEEENVQNEQFPIKISQKITNTNGLRNLSNVEKTLTNDQIDSQEVELDSLTNCTIYLKGAPSILRLVNIRESKIFAGPVSSSIFIVNCHECRLQIVGQQMRIHDSTNCDIFQHITSRTIIENCSKLRFGLFSWNYDQMGDDFVKASIDKNVNNWTQIDDFDCLAGPSPNWCLIEE